MPEEQYTIKQYGRRWINLFLFIIYGINNGIHCAQYSVINDSISAYYNVPHTYVEWTTGLFTLSYVLFSTPALYAMGKIVSYTDSILFLYSKKGLHRRKETFNPFDWTKKKVIMWIVGEQPFNSPQSPLYTYIIKGVEHII